MKKIFFFFAFLQSFSVLYAQQFGNEWINFDQLYYKFNVAKEGMYRLTYQELKKAGFPVDAVNPKQIQIFTKGKEIAIHMVGEADNKFDPSDYIEFYGTYNNGDLDTDLYTSPSEQPHTHYSLYQDSLPYYITWQVGKQGKRWNKYTDLNYTGKVRDSFFMYAYEKYFREYWVDGTPFANGQGQYSEYNVGEGWFSSAYSNGGYSYVAPTPYYYANGPSPVLKFDVYGKNDNVNLGGDGNNQEISIFVGPSNTLVYQFRFKGYKRINDSIVLSKSLLTDNTNYSISSSISGGRMVNGYVKFLYPRLFNLGGASQFKLQYNSANNYVELDNYGKVYPLVYDIHNATTIQSSYLSGKVKINLPSGANNRELFIYDSLDVVTLEAGLINQVQFQNHNFGTTNYDFIILSNTKLDSAVKIYKTYRESNEGGNHTVFVGLFPNLYDQYYYGIHHPLAIRNIVNEIVTKQTAQPEHLLLIGKGQTYNRITLDYKNRMLEDLVPTYGVPPSDYALTSMLNSNSLAPAIPTGRIPCRTNEQLIQYLEKVKLHERPTSALWKKNVIHLAGGVNSSENNQFKNYLNNYASTLSKPFFGGKVNVISKTDPLPTVGNLTTRIQHEINQGSSMVTYFGHGAAQVLEVEIGEAFQFNNEGKYPFFYFNGCALGNCFEQYSIPESFLFEPKVGCISWAASTSFGFTGELHSYCNTLHQNLFDKNYGKSIGYNFKEAIKQYQQLGNDYNRNNCRQLIYLGDPSIKIYSPELPDYQIASGSLKEYKVEGNLVDKFATFTIQNPGKATLDTLEIEIKVKNSSGDTLTLPIIYKNNLFHTDTVVVNLTQTGWNIGGIITFDITLDPRNNLDELLPLGESNNRFNGLLFYASNGLRTVYPLKDQIVHKTEATLRVQSLNIYSSEQEIYFELDTTPLFNSPELIKTGIIKGTNLIEKTFALPPLDSTDFYWRARLNLPLDKGGEWVNNTFRYIYKSPNGWSQGYFNKFNESTPISINLDNTSKKFEFARTTSSQYTLQTFGRDANVGNIWRFMGIDNGGTGVDKFGFFNENGIRILAINPDDESRYIEPSKYNLKATEMWWPYTGAYGEKYYKLGNYTGVYQFNTKLKQDRDSLKLFLENIPENYHFFLYSGLEMDVDSWDVDLVNKFGLFGIEKISFNQNGHPYLAKGQKGLNPGEAIEILPDLVNSTVPPEKQQLTYSSKIYPKLSSGNMVSPPIGPASTWNMAYLNAHTDQYDSVLVEIIGIDNQGNDITLFQPALQKTIDLSSVDAALYPFVKIKWYAHDAVNRTPWQMKNWTVLYDGIPEGTIMPVEDYSLSIDTLYENSPYVFKAAFKNISEYPMDSLSVLAITKNALTQSIDTVLFNKYKALNPGDSFHFTLHVNTLGKKGINEMVIQVNPNKLLKEQSLANNLIIKQFYIKNDRKNPLLDVTFDGAHIMNRDIVSPKTVINITAKDDNPFIFIDDINQFEIKLKTPLIDSFITLDLHSADFNFKPAQKAADKAELMYSPKDLQNGIYTLSAQVKDKNNNPAAISPYQIDFKIVTESTVTRVYPYPNPFTSSTKFVFTLTGDKIPDVMNIGIYTVTGKMVKNISLKELGNIKIGNNITDYAWDGTDEYGDKLANGVYLYKVTAKIDGKTIELNEDKNSDLFQHGMGKLYILR